MDSSSFDNLAESPPQPTSERLMQLTWGYAPVLVIEAALAHGVFEVLQPAPLSVSELAIRTGTSPRGLKALLNALVGLELLRKHPLPPAASASIAPSSEPKYSLTAESAAFLISGAPEYCGGLFQHHVQQVLPRWQHLKEAVRTGRPPTTADDSVEEQDHFARFVESLFVRSYRSAQNLGHHLGISALGSSATALDLGAGSGVWGIALLEQCPHLTVWAVDWPKVLEVTKRVAVRHGVADRLRLVPGDLMTADFGSGHRVATIGQVLHSLGPEHSQALLRKAFTALCPGATVVISEFIPNEERTGPLGPLLFAINMLVHNPDGDVFTASEMTSWLEEAGFSDIRLFEAGAASPLLLAIKPTRA